MRKRGHGGASATRSGAAIRTSSCRPGWRPRSPVCSQAVRLSARRRSRVTRRCAARAGSGRSAAGRALDHDALELAVAAAVRHEDTPYDTLLMSGVERGQARAEVRLAGSSGARRVATLMTGSRRNADLRARTAATPRCFDKTGAIRCQVLDAHVEPTARVHTCDPCGPELAPDQQALPRHTSDVRADRRRCRPAARDLPGRRRRTDARNLRSSDCGAGTRGLAIDAQLATRRCVATCGSKPAFVAARASEAPLRS